MKEFFDDPDLLALRKRNEERAREMREAMGAAYLCHPSNRVQKLDGSSRRTGGDSRFVAASRQLVLMRMA